MIKPISTSDEQLDFGFWCEEGYYDLNLRFTPPDSSYFNLMAPGTPSPTVFALPHLQTLILQNFNGYLSDDSGYGAIRESLILPSLNQYDLALFAGLYERQILPLYGCDHFLFVDALQPPPPQHTSLGPQFGAMETVSFLILDISLFRAAGGSEATRLRSGQGLLAKPFVWHFPGGA